MEIERQFLVESLPSLPTEYETIRQGYVALEPEIRIKLSEFTAIYDRLIPQNHFLRKFNTLVGNQVWACFRNSAGVI